MSALHELKTVFEKTRNTVEAGEVAKLEKTLKKADGECLEYLYSLLNEPCTQTVFSTLCKGFPHLGSLGESFLLKKLETETDPHSKGIVLQILGRFKYSGGKRSEETANIAREYLVSEDTFLRNRAAIVLGWVGNENDIDSLEERMKLEEDKETRGWLSTALMQIYLNCNSEEKQKTRLLRILKDALLEEQDDFTIQCILVSIQEISRVKLGISPTCHTALSRKKIDAAKRKALELL